jgi:hypothetical protein
MKSKVHVRGCVVGLIVGLAVFVAFGAVTSTGRWGPYQLSMAANDTYVFYGRIHTGTGHIETWRYVTHSTAVSRPSDDRILREPNLPQHED